MAIDPTEARGQLVFVTVAPKHLHAYANAQKRNAPRRDSMINRVKNTGFGHQRLAARRKGAIAGQQ